MSPWGSYISSKAKYDSPKEFGKKNRNSISNVNSIPIKNLMSYLKK